MTEPITDLKVIGTQLEDYTTDQIQVFLGGSQIASIIQAPPNYLKLPVDLNKGAGGNYIYLYYLKENIQSNYPFSQGINPEALNNPDREYEQSRVQIDGTKALVWVKKLNLLKQRTNGKGVPFNEVVEKVVGTEESNVTNFSVEVGITAGAGFGGFSTEINTKLGYSTTNSFTTSKKETRTETYNIEAKDYIRTFAVCDVVDILRTVEIPSGNILSELISPTVHAGAFVTDEYGRWVSENK